MIGITMGDANGVGPEIVLKAYKENQIDGEFIVIGDYSVLDMCNSQLSIQALIREMSDLSDYQPGFLNVLSLGILEAYDLDIGKISKKTGEAALMYIRKAIDLALKDQINGMVTLPINKEAVRLSEPDFRGHTDYLAELSNVSNYTMMLVSENLIVTHNSMHVSLQEAIDNVKTETIYNVIRLTDEAVKKIRPQCRIAVAGLNPHAGEGGAFGEEDIKEILPAVLLAQGNGMDVSGPVPPDTVFYQAVNGVYDAVVCMYHDQGHIPMKLLDFEGAVNVSLGMPITRTSVDHGTAFDIAYTGVASIASFCNAYDLARKIILQ